MSRIPNSSSRHAILGFIPAQSQLQSQPYTYDDTPDLYEIGCSRPTVQEPSESNLYNQTSPPTFPSSNSYQIHPQVYDVVPASRNRYQRTLPTYSLPSSPTYKAPRSSTPTSIYVGNSDQMPTYFPEDNSAGTERERRTHFSLPSSTFASPFKSGGAPAMALKTIQATAAAAPRISKEFSAARSKMKSKARQIYVAGIFYRKYADNLETSRAQKALRIGGQVMGSSLGLIVLMSLYTLLGAFVFMTLEGPNEKNIINDVESNRNETLKELWSNSQNLSMEHEEWHARAVEIINKYRQIIETANKYGVDSDTSLTKRNWDFFGAVFFCLTVYTTIGYGHITPHTSYGRLATIVYAVVGIPLCLIVLAKVGNFFSRILNTSWVWSFYMIRKLFSRSKRTKKFTKSWKAPPIPTEKHKAGRSTSNTAGPTSSSTGNGDVPGEGDDSNELPPESYTFCAIYSRSDSEFNFPVSLAVLLLFVYVFLGAFIYRFWEHWSFLESFYFIFISISTIGFGDIVPNHPKFFLVFSLYVFVGLSLVSMVINVLMAYISKKLAEAQERLDQIVEANNERSRALHVAADATITTTPDGPSDSNPSSKPRGLFNLVGAAKRPPPGDARETSPDYDGSRDDVEAASSQERKPNRKEKLSKLTQNFKLPLFSNVGNPDERPREKRWTTCNPSAGPQDEREAELSADNNNIDKQDSSLKTPDREISRM